MLARRLLLVLPILTVLWGCSRTEEVKPGMAISNATQAELAKIADHMEITYRVVENRGAGKCTAEGDASPCYIAQIKLTAHVPIDVGGWEIYFSQVDPVASATSDEFAIQHINGDLHRIYPTERFSGFASGDTKTIDLIGRGLVLNETKLMPNYYVVAPRLDPLVIASTKVRIDPETGLEVRPYVVPLTDPAQFKSQPDDNTEWATAARLFTQNNDLSLAVDAVPHAIIPTPREMVVQDGSLDLAAGIAVQGDLTAADLKPALDRLALLSIRQNEQGVPVRVAIAKQGDGGAESYSLRVNADGIEIAAADRAGAFYGLMSVAALVMPGKTDIPQVTVTDAPHYTFRGMHVDVARNFHSKEFLLKLMDEMAAYKLNKLHLHLGDDEGWRLEINGLPELTEIGGKRCHDLNENTCLLPQLGSGPHGDTKVDGFYSIADYRDILQYASQRNIQVIPSFDMPGHSRAVIKAMEARYRTFMKQGKEKEARRYLLSDMGDQTRYESIQFYKDNTINVCMESTYNFIDRVMDEMKAVHAAAGQPLTLYHIGADETAGAWVDSPVCHEFLANNDRGIADAHQLGAYFIERVAGILAQKGIRAAGWNDGMGETNPANMPANVQSNLWALLGDEGHKIAHRHANYGWDAVLSTPDVLYFDFPQAADPKEHGYYWGSRETTTRDVFEFMPDNLPVHAEFRTNQRGLPFVADDREQRNDDGEVEHQPLQRGNEFVGIQGHIWSETIRSDELVEYMVFPRLLVLAERAWHKADWAVPYNYDGALYNQSTNTFTADKRARRDAEWNRFANILAQKALPKLDLANIQYRLPTVGAVVEGGVLKANVALPGLAIEYRVDGGAWQRYDGPVKVKGKAIEVRSVAPNGERKGRAIQV